MVAVSQSPSSNGTTTAMSMSLPSCVKDNVSHFPKLPSNRNSYEDFAVMEGDIVMINGQRFYHIYCSRDMGELKYTTQGTFGGKSMKANLEIYHPGFKPKLLGFIASVMNSEAIILARLNNGATISFVYDTPTAQVYTGEMDSLIGQSTNLDDEPVTP